MGITTLGPGAYVLAFVGGLTSFASPCVLPLVPAYLSVVTGVEVTELRESPRPLLGGIARDTALFVAGFTTVFTLLGLSASSIGVSLVHHQILFTRIAGAVVMAMGLFLLGSLVLQAPWLYREVRFHPRLSRFGRAAPVVAGAAFAFGWTPCIGPVLTSIYAIAATQSRAWAGGSLLAVYGLGLGLPFLACGLALGRLTGVFGWAKRRLRLMVIVTGGALTFMGALLVFDRLAWVTTEIQQAFRAIGLGRIVNLG